MICNISCSTKKEKEQSCHNERPNSNVQYGLRKYAYFDEFDMCGKGIPTTNEYVLVNKSNDLIIVKYHSAFINDSVIYTFCNQHNCWYSEKRYDWDRGAYYKDGRYPREYFRWLMGDTIMDLKRIYDSNRERVLCSLLFLKTRKNYTIVNLCDNEFARNINNRDELFSHIRFLSKSYKKDFVNLNLVDHIVAGVLTSYSNEEGYLLFNNDRFKGKLSLVANTIKDSLIYSAPQIIYYSTPGVEGFEEKRLKKRSLSPTHDGVYFSQHVDSLPVILSSGESVNEYINNLLVVRRMFITKAVVVLLTVSNNGAILDAKIARSGGIKADQIAKDICYNLPKLKPAKKQGKEVSVEMTIVIGRAHVKTQ